MALVKKPIGALLVGGTGIGITHASGGFGTNVVSPTTIDSKGFLGKIQMQHANVNDFLKLGTKNLQHSELIKDYVLTISGAKDFGRLLVGSLLIDLIDHFPENSASALQKSIKSRLDAVRLNSAPTGEEADKQKIYSLYGGENMHKSHHSLKNIRKIAIDELSSHLPAVLSNSTEDLKGTQDGDDLIKNGLGLFYDKLLDDYIAFAKPVFVKRFFFEYRNDDIHDDLRSRYEPDKRPSDFRHPNRAGYLFPYLKSKDKWEALKNASDLSSETPSDSNSDDPNSPKQVISLTSIEDQSQTSQFIIAALRLQNSSSSTDKLNTVKLISDLTTANETTVDDIKDLEKNAIFFRDRKGVHVLVKDTSKDTDTKKHLIAAAKNTSDSDYRFDLQKELKIWMEKHFERIILSQWEEIKNKQSGHSTEMEKYKDLAKELTSLLESVLLRDTLISLRKGAIKDYMSLAETYAPVKWGGKYQQNPLLKFSGKFPYEPNSDASKKLKDVQLVYADLENLFLHDKGKSSNRAEYEAKITDKYKSFSDKVSSLVTTNAADLVSQSEDRADTKEKLYMFKPKDTEKKLLQISNFFNSLWIRMIHDGSAEHLFFQKQLRDYIDKRILKNGSGGSGSASGTSNDLKSIFDALKESHLKNGDVLSKVTKDLFQSSSSGSQDFSKILHRRLLLSKIKESLKSSMDPAIFAKDLLHKISDLKDYSSLETIAKNLQTFYGDGGYDALSPFQKDLLAELVTIEFLSRDKLNNMRKVLKHRFTKDGAAAFIFSKKYAPTDPCVLNGANLDTALNFDHKKVLSFRNELLGHKSDASSQSWQGENCLTREEFFDFAILSADSNFTDGSSNVKAGYKGLVFSDKFSEAVSEEMAPYLKQLPIWGKANTIADNAGEVKTEKAFEALVTQLKETFPTVSWSFVEQKHWINPRADYRTHNHLSSRLTLDQRKNILRGFLSQQTNTLDANSSLQHQSAKQREWASGKAQLQHNNSFLKTKLLRHNGFLSKHGSKVLRDAAGNQYLIYLIQMKYDDLETAQSWQSFLKTIGADLIAAELVKLAQDKTLQKQAIYHLLNETKDNEGMDKLTVGDSRLADKLGITWLNLT